MVLVPVAAAAAFMPWHSKARKVPLLRPAKTMIGVLAAMVLPAVPAFFNPWHIIEPRLLPLFRPATTIIGVLVQAAPAFNLSPLSIITAATINLYYQHQPVSWCCCRQNNLLELHGNAWNLMEMR